MENIYRRRFTKEEIGAVRDTPITPKETIEALKALGLASNRLSGRVGELPRHLSINSSEVLVWAYRLFMLRKAESEGK